MRRTLPERASLDHLKKQAKDLLHDHERGEKEALARIRDAVPAFAGKTDAEIAAAPFALHDAQSAIAREYGQKSWNELRAAVEAQATGVPFPSPEALRALMPLPFPPEVGALLQAAAGKRDLAAAVATSELPPSLPLVPVRNALFLPRALGPIHVGRPSTHAAVAAGFARTPPTIAVFAQRSATDEEPGVDGFHAVGCEAYLHARHPDGTDAKRAWVVLEGVRWIALGDIDAGPGHRIARVTPVVRDEGDAAEIAPLAEALRAHARDLASYFPDAARLVALIDAAEPDRLADLVVANLPVPVEDKARYAAEPRLVERLRLASTLSGLKTAG